MPLVVYNTGIPAAGNNPSVDQPDMKTNTDAVDTILAVDHYSFNDALGGTHAQVTLTNEAAPGLNGGTGVLYANVASGQSWPFWQNATGSFQLLGKNNLSQNGYLTIGNGLLIQWGRNTTISGGSFASGDAKGTVTYPITFNSVVYTIYTTPFYSTTEPGSAGSVSIDDNIVSLTTYDWKFRSNSGQYTGFYWLAIGK